MRMVVAVSLALALAGAVGPAWSQAAPPVDPPSAASPAAGAPAGSGTAQKKDGNGDFEALRSRRATIVARLPALQDELKELDEKLKSLRSSESFLSDTSESSDVEQFLRFVEEKKASIDGAIVDTKARLGEARRRTPPDDVEIKKLTDLLSTQESELRRVETDRRRAEQQRDAEARKQARTQQQLITVQGEIATLNGRIADRKKEIAELSREQSEIENRINLLLIPQNQENQFKLYITGAFTVLVGLVIVGFFIVAVADEKVRQSIFSSQSGIQFLTLFSLVIAIILFGITKILEGKELAALLGGLSGYILGRVGKD